MKKFRNKSSFKNKNGSIKKYIIMSLKSTVCLIVLFLISGSICYFGNIDFDKYFIFLIISLILSAFISGLSFSRRNKSRGVVNGIIASIPIIIIISASALIINKGKVSILLLISVLIIILSGAVAGSIGVNMRR